MHFVLGLPLLASLAMPVSASSDIAYCSTVNTGSSFNASMCSCLAVSECLLTFSQTAVSTSQTVHAKSYAMTTMLLAFLWTNVAGARISHQTRQPTSMSPNVAMGARVILLIAAAMNPRGTMRTWKCRCTWLRGQPRFHPQLPQLEPRLVNSHPRKTNATLALSYLNFRDESCAYLTVH